MSTKINRYPDIEKKEKVEIKNTSNVLNEIFNKHSEKIFLKIDCEGAEFDIIEDLDNSGLLSLVDVLCLEWHFQKPDSIINILKNKNFIVFNSDTIKNELGFIRAVKN